MVLQKICIHTNAVKAREAQETIWVKGAASKIIGERYIKYSNIALPYLPFTAQVLFSTFLT
jgi:hypothetical protein